ncbi:MAG: CBS domain-containing protein [Candidatus Thermoplasmatota archaeon]
MKVKEVMSKNVISLTPMLTVGEATRIFAEHNISGAPVIDENDCVIGILSEADILKLLRLKYKQMSIVFPAVHLLGVGFRDDVKYGELKKAFDEVSSTLVRDVMRTNVITASPEDEVEEIAPIMVKMNINRIPIVENKKLVGIVARGDVIRGIFSKKANPI